MWHGFLIVLLIGASVGFWILVSLFLRYGLFQYTPPPLSVKVLVHWPGVKKGVFPPHQIAGITFTNPNIVSNPFNNTYIIILRGINYTAEMLNNMTWYDLVSRNMGFLSHGYRTRNFITTCTPLQLDSWTSPNNQKVWSRDPQEMSMGCDLTMTLCQKGYEDARLFWVGSQLYCVASLFHFGGVGGMGLISVDEKFQITRVIPLCYEGCSSCPVLCQHNNTMEKNWIPFVSKDKVCVITHWSPMFRLYYLNVLSGQLTLAMEKAWSHIEGLRGSSPPLYHPKLGWVAICHTKDKNSIYHHYFVQFDEQQGIKNISAPFMFEGQTKTEFSTSFTTYNSTNTIITYSVGDATSQFVMVPWNVIETVFL